MSNTPNPLLSDQTSESLKWAFDQGRNSFAVQDIDGEEFLVSARPPVLTDLEAFRSAPRRTKRSPVFADPASFVKYYETFKGDETLLVGSLSAKTVEATFDYDAPKSPAWGDHKATLKSLVTPEWAAFKKANNVWFSQTDFADFLEQWNHVVIDPSAAHMAEVAMNLQGSVNATYQAKINRANGTATFCYSEEVETGQVRVPSKFHISVWPFEGTPLVDVLVLLRFRIDGGKPKFQIVIQNAERIEAEALKNTFAEVEKATGRKVLIAP